MVPNSGTGFLSKLFQHVKLVDWYISNILYSWIVISSKAIILEIVFCSHNIQKSKIDLFCLDRNNKSCQWQFWHAVCPCTEWHTIPTKRPRKEHNIQPSPFSLPLSRLKTSCKSFIIYTPAWCMHTHLSHIFLN